MMGLTAGKGARNYILHPEFPKINESIYSTCLFACGLVCFLLPPPDHTDADTLRPLARFSSEIPDVPHQFLK